MTIPFSSVAHLLEQTCAAGRARASIALTEAFGAPWECELGAPFAWQTDSLPPEWSHSGLVFIFQSGQNAAVVILPDADAVTPAWCAQPDATGQAKLRSLAQELAGAFFPSKNASPECTVGRVKDLRESLTRMEPAANAALVPVTLRSGEQSGSMWILWPASNVDSMPLEAVAKVGGSQARREGVAAGTATSRGPVRYQDREEGIGLLPTYSRSLLRIRVPVTVTLAAAKQSLDTILNIGAGSIIHFNKSCEDTLTLEVAGHKVAVGETVKVGDKFGLWITSMILPDERFWILSSRQAPTRAR